MRSAITLSLLSLLSLLGLAQGGPITKRATKQYIYAGRDGLCLSLGGGSGTIPYNGASVISLPCAGASVWDISPGSGSVILSGTNFALDAGSNPGDHGSLKVWQSYPGLYQQTWYLTADNRIAITGGTQCLDEGSNGVQTYTCTTGNTNQVWFTKASVPAPPTSSSVPPTSSSAAPSSSASPSSTSSSTAPTSTSNPNAAGVLVFSTRDQYCITPDVAPGNLAAIGNGTPVVSRPCSTALRWTVNRNQPASLVVTGTNFALDAGLSQSNNQMMKVWTSYPGVNQQTWSWYQDQAIRLSSGTWCLDEGPGGIQLYTCFTGNVNQVFAERS